MHTLKPRILRDMHEQLPKYSIISKKGITGWEYTKGTFCGDNYEMDDFQGTINNGDRWKATYDCAYFFKASVTVPEEMDGKKIRAKLAVGGEALVKCNGKFVAGCTSRDFMPDRADVDLGAFKAGDVLNFEVEATVDSMCFCDEKLAGAEYQDCVFGETSIAVIDEETEGYYIDLDVAFEALDYIKDDHIKSKVYAAIDDSLHIVDFDFEPDRVRESVKEARKLYLDRLSQIKWTAQSRVIHTGHSHIDVAWLWRVQESIRKSARTFSNVTHLMDIYPEMTFGQSQAVLYQMTKDNYPEIYEKIKEKVANNQWDICGNVWVEADTNLASGESLIRQVLYGTEFFKKEFGKVSKTYWLPDCFGFTAALPQIIKGCGMENFITSKLSNNDTTKFPFNMFRWQGNNGDTIYAHLMYPSYNCNFRVRELMVFDDECNNKSELDTAMGMYGFGDGGGGPTRNMLERGRRLQNFPGLPKAEIGHVDDFFDTLHGHDDELPVWSGEMFYENHRGTYTSQAFVKKNNRKFEYLLERIEMLSSLAEIKDGKKYPKEELEKLWRMLMTNQFHDILPGSSIHEVFEDCHRDYAILGEKARALFEDVVSHFGTQLNFGKDAVTVWNLTNADSTQPVEVKGVPAGMLAKGMPSVNKDGTLIFVPDVIPAMSCKVFALEKRETIESNDKSIALENDYLKVAFDENGIITSIFDKENKCEALDGRGNILTISQDKCIHETAWNLELNYLKKMWELDKADCLEVIENNELRKIIKVVRSFNKSEITQYITLYANGRSVIFDTSVDWHETDKVLKAGFDVNVINSDATYNIAHGAVTRPTHWNTPYDLTRYEVAAHKWADLSEGGYGCSIINDCKYGYDIHNSHMRLTLMRAPTCPDKTGDHGINTFRYAFYPHKNDWRNGTVQEGITFNVTPVGVYSPASNGNASETALPECDSKNIMIDAFKKAQDGRGYIIRFVEDEQRRGTANVKLPFAAKEIIETNMIEDDKTAANATADGFSFSYKPFEVKTFRIIV